jgi:hypothetical protein
VSSKTVWMLKCAVERTAAPSCGWAKKQLIVTSARPLRPGASAAAPTLACCAYQLSA